MVEEKKIDKFISTKIDLGEGKGVLTVVGWGGERDKSYNKIYNISCSKCHNEDPELYYELFRSIKGNLLKLQAPCGCTKTPRWTQGQYRVLLQREANSRGEIFLAFLGEEWKGTYSKISIQCSHEHTYQPTINDYKNGGKGCPRCSWHCRIQACAQFELLAATKGDSITGDYMHSKTKVIMVCKKGHEFSITPNSYKAGKGCMVCWRQESKVGNGYYPERTTNEDCLYLIECLDSNDNVVCIKVGRSFPHRLDARFKEIERGLGLIVRPYRIIKSDHRSIFHIEQYVVNKGRFKHYYNEYTTEALKADQLDKVDGYLDGVSLAYENKIISDIYY